MNYFFNKLNVRFGNFQFNSIILIKRWIPHISFYLNFIMINYEDFKLIIDIIWICFGGEIYYYIIRYKQNNHNRHKDKIYRLSPLKNSFAI